MPRKNIPEDVSIFPQISLNDIRGKLFVLRDDLDFDWEPSGNAVLKLLFSLRLSAALWSNISDCDEVYNYWEPLPFALVWQGAPNMGIFSNICHKVIFLHISSLHSCKYSLSLIAL
ncbi:hypothetical protein OSTOST_18592, partial [Ostertagia ostertagi]